MKTTIRITTQLVLAAILILTACKKKDDDKTSDPSPTTNPTPPTNPVTATVNGTAFSTYYANNSFSTVSGKNFGLNYYLLAGNTSNPYETGFSFNVKYGVGTYTLSALSTSDYKAFYKSKYPGGADSIHTFNVNTGTINITQFDTVLNDISKLKATFSFTTQTAKNVTYSVTSAVIDYTKP